MQQNVRDDTRKNHSFGGAPLLIILVVTALGSAVWANLWKSELRVMDIRVDGNTIVADEEILSLANISKGQKLYDVDLLATRLRVMRNAFMKSVAVNREAPGRISIAVDERVPIAAVVLDKIGYLDADGVVLSPAHSENIFDLPVLTGAFQPGEFVPGKQITKAEVKEALDVLATAHELSDEVYRQISEVRVESGRDLVFYTAESGVPVIFGRGDTGLKLVKFDGFWREIVFHHGAHELEYIDLRFEDQVVVRWLHPNEEEQPAKEPEGQMLKARKS